MSKLKKMIGTSTLVNLGYHAVAKKNKLVGADAVAKAVTMGTGIPLPKPSRIILAMQLMRGAAPSSSSGGGEKEMSEDEAIVRKQMENLASRVGNLSEKDRMVLNNMVTALSETAGRGKNVFYDEKGQMTPLGVAMIYLGLQGSGEKGYPTDPKEQTKIIRDIYETIERESHRWSGGSGSKGS